MKATISYILGSILFLPFITKAESDRCLYPNTKMTCTTSYNFEYSPIVKGPRGAGIIEDRQPEIFDPALCAAAVVLYTSEGKFTLDYYEKTQSLQMWKEFAHKSALIIEKASVINGHFETTLPTIIPGDIKTITFSCEVTTSSN